jgi:hypothetical protein
MFFVLAFIEKFATILKKFSGPEQFPALELIRPLLRQKLPSASIKHRAITSQPRANVVRIILASIFQKFFSLISRLVAIFLSRKKL